MDLESLQAIALAVAQERSIESVLKVIVGGLIQQSQIALARIWLIDKGDICSTCPMRTECPDQSHCLHLVASAGIPTDPTSEDWSRLDGAFRRFPLDVRKIGRIGATGEAMLLRDISDDAGWIARPDWFQREGILSFAGQPLVFRGEILGVLAIFSRLRLDEREFAWLRSFADHAAVAIANSRAFTQIYNLRKQLELENAYLREEVDERSKFSDIVGNSLAQQNILKQVTLVAPTEANVLITGESGTGKELVARAIHEQSLRRGRPMIKVNCASIPRELFESEFFGHVKGAFTGAVRDRTGRFQLADSGTLFLDEVGEIPLDLQSKLLRVLQEGQFERVGEEKTRSINVRIIAATNRNLAHDIETGHFRQDLYYRLSVFPIEVPPLRERTEDIPFLVEHYLRRSAVRKMVKDRVVAEADMQRLQNYDWPGNVRELQNVLERALIISQNGPFILGKVLGDPIHARSSRRENIPPYLKASEHAESDITDREIISAHEWEKMEKQNIILALRRTKGRISGPHGAAKILGIKPTTLASRIKALGIKKMNNLN
jgi:transcriptional regulator with GAF, ATPase, and Fis domain